MPKPKDTRSKYVHWLIGQATDVLRNDFVERVSRGDQIDNRHVQFEAILGPFDAADQGGMFEIVVVFERLGWVSQREVSANWNHNWNGGRSHLAVLENGWI